MKYRISSRPLHVDVAKCDCRKFVSVPEKHHTMDNEKNYHPKGKIQKTNGWICKVVDMEKAEEKEENSWKVGDSVITA